MDTKKDAKKIRVDDVNRAVRSGNWEAARVLADELGRQDNRLYWIANMVASQKWNPDYKPKKKAVRKTPKPGYDHIVISSCTETGLELIEVVDRLSRAHVQYVVRRPEQLHWPLGKANLETARYEFEMAKVQMRHSSAA